MMPWSVCSSPAFPRGVLIGVLLSVLFTLDHSPILRTAVAQETAEQKAAACSNGSGFATARQFAVGLNPRAVVISDFNKDGIADLAVADSGAQNNDNVTILLGNGQGAFAPATNIRLSSFAFNFLFKALVVGDFNRDGNPDLVAAGIPITVAGTSTFGVAVILGNGDGTFGAPVIYPTGNGATDVVAADFNNDNKLDLAVVNQTDSNISILSGNGDGKFGPATNYPVIFGPRAITTVDLNSDGKPDLAVAGNGGISLLTGNGAGGFNPPVTISRLSGSLAVVASDLNGDHKPDLIIGLDIALAVLINDGTGNFGEPDLINTVRAASVITGDFNGDGKADLALTSTRSPGSFLSVMLGNGAGGFSQPVSFGAGKSPVALASGDFNHDNKPDLAVINNQSNSVSILSGSNRIFDAPVLAGTYGSRAITAGDFNKDGRLDPVTSSTNSGITVTLSDATTGGYPTIRTYSSAFKISDVAEAAVAGDFNKDGNTDLVVVSGDRFGNTNSVVTLLPGNVSSIFDQNKTKAFNVGLRAADLVVADFNRDGNLDVATANAGSNDLSLLLGDGRGGFSAAVSFQAGPEPRSLVVSDFNGDGNPDLAVANRNSAAISILLGDGQGSFTSSLIGIGANPGVIVTGDFNGDNRADLAVTSNNSSTLAILLGNANGTFNSPTRLDAGKKIRGVIAGDFNGDGKTDLALTLIVSGLSFGNLVETSADSVLLLAGNGSGGFAAVGEWFVPAAVYLKAGDFDGDGLSDLAVVSDGGGGIGSTVWILRAVCQAPPTNVVTTVSAASYRDVAVAAESIVAAFGTSLSTQTVTASTLPLPTQLDGTTVKIKDRQGQERLAPLFFVSAGQINYQVPVGTAPGLATVTITNKNNVSSSGIVLIIPVTPGLFTANSDGQGVPSAQVLRVTPEGKQSYEDVAQFDATLNRFVPRPIPLRSVSGNPLAGPDQLFLVLYGTGFRGVRSPGNVTANVAGLPGEVLFAGPQGGFVGLDQLNVKPPFISNREADVEIFVEGIKTNTVRISFGQ